MSLTKYNGLFFTSSKILPIYNPMIPNTDIISPVEKKMDAIILAHPRTEDPKKTTLTTLNRINRPEIIDK